MDIDELEHLKTVTSFWKQHVTIKLNWAYMFIPIQVEWQIRQTIEVFTSPSLAH